MFAVRSGSLSGALAFIDLKTGCASQFLPPDELFAESEAIHPRREAALKLVATIEGYGHSGIGARNEFGCMANLPLSRWNSR